MVLDEEVNGEREDQFLKDAGLFLFLQKLSIDKCDCMMRKFDDEFFIVDVDTCLAGAGPDGKHTSLEAVTIVLDLPPPQPGSVPVLMSVDI